MKDRLVSADPDRKVQSRLDLPGSLATVAAAHLEREIIEGRLRPGERLLEHAWASELGISRGSFREVLRILATAGLVDIVPRRGASVAATSTKDVKEIFFLRKHLMSIAAAAAAESITDDQVEALEKIMQTLEEATDRADISKYFRWNLAFHDMVVDISGIGRLRDLLQYLGKSTLRYRFIGLSLPGGMSASLQANREILNALASRDSTAAGGIVFRMVERAGEALTDALEQGGDEGPGVQRQLHVLPARSGDRPGASGESHRGGA
jgi:DNA-binding GntR family transcriptional regulator